MIISEQNSKRVVKPTICNSAKTKTQCLQFIYLLHSFATYRASHNGGKAEKIN